MIQIMLHEYNIICYTIYIFWFIIRSTYLFYDFKKKVKWEGPAYESRIYQNIKNNSCINMIMIFS